MVRKSNFGGARRWSPALAITIGLASQAPFAAGQGAMARKVSLSARAETAAVLDSAARARAKVMVSQIDSMLRLQEGLPIGSSEFVRVQFALDSLIRNAMPQRVFVRGMPTQAGGGEGGSIVMVAPSAPAMTVRGGRMSEELSAKLMSVMPRGWIGMDANGFHNDIRDETGFFVRYFEYPIVVGVDPNSPAARSGIRFGDSLMAYDGQDLRTGVINLTKLLEPGRTLAVKLRREGEMKEFTVQVEKAPPAIEAERKADLMRNLMVARAGPPTLDIQRVGDESRPRVAPRAQSGGRGFGEMPVGAVAARMTAPSGILGAQILDLDQDALRTLRNDKNAYGVIVGRVGDATPAYRLGLRSGDVIVKVDDEKIESLWQLQHEMIARRQNPTTKLVVLRGKKTQTLVYEQPR